MVAMQVAGTMTLGDLIAQACACGAEVVASGLRVRSTEFDEWYTPRYLLLNDRHVPLPTTDDDAYMLDVHIVEFICVRLGLVMEITRNGMIASTRLFKPDGPPRLKVVK